MGSRRFCFWEEGRESLRGGRFCKNALPAPLPKNFQMMLRMAVQLPNELDGVYDKTGPLYKDRSNWCNTWYIEDRDAQLAPG